MNIPIVMLRSGLLRPGRPIRMIRQFGTLGRWGTTLAGEFISAAARDPRRTAIVDERGELTFRQVDLRTSALATALVEDRIGPRPRVGVLCRNHRGMVESLIACSKRGAEVVLLNTGLGEGQLKAVLDELWADVLVADAEFEELLARAPRKLRRVTAWADYPARGVTLEDLIAATPVRRLYPPGVQSRSIFLSSGTTGRPKGARRPPRPGISPLTSMLSRIPLRVHDTMLIEAPLFHTWGYAAMQMGIALRATLVFSRRFDPKTTLRLISEHRRVALIAVPVMLQRILDLPVGMRESYDVSSLRLAALSGAALPGDLAVQFSDAFRARLYNVYGSTEASWVSIAGPKDLRAHPGTAGRPPVGTTIAILDAGGEPVPPGVTGRIFAANEMLYEGYTGGEPAEMRKGLLCTSDMGHLDRKGRLFVDGREDDMVVSGGENIFPREVEDVLVRMPEVREAAVVGVPDREFGQRLVAYVVVHPKYQLDAGTIRSHVHDQLARYAVPRDVHFLDELPRNATGKVVTRWLSAAAGA